ncbi:hypothetical protein PR202_gb16136 [Eleusine coracana subsp. coracana]|uniref:Serpin domain-containing protein n=1 Tax=Eleusine coracana subsp. coracana TaxID=191504 RepID=A0AAV5EZL7_ELECO|nr:hypothetical protein PR202_gb16122 [Eleusine coracana subsp. coracana]GJN28055.1 hypothetical protein PR202_gb16136 [Eleusine coracana subsp. coracana]
MASIKGNIATSACQAGQVALVVRLLKRISAAAADEDNNLIFSPLLIHIVLTLMSAVAARDTLDEILNIAGVMSQEELASLVKSMVMDGVLIDRSTVGGSSILFASVLWSDKQ